MSRITFIILIFSLIAFSCSSSKVVSAKSSCVENPIFKKSFFENVQNVDDFMTAQTQFKSIEDVVKYNSNERVKDFNKSLLFISKYSEVSFDSMLNYDRSYPFGVYEDDRNKWLKWYDENKCLNIQFVD